MLSVKSLGTEKELVKSDDYKKQTLTYAAGDTSICISDTIISANPKVVGISLVMPFFMDTAPSITFNECYIVPYNDGVWNKVVSVSNVNVVNNILKFDVTVENTLNVNTSTYLLIRAEYGSLTLTWGGGNS